MQTTGHDLPTRFASPERLPVAAVKAEARQLRNEPLINWFDAMPIPMVVINDHRQILFSNEAFCAVSLKTECTDVLGLRPGEALDCIHAHVMEAGCGCSDFCSACGAAIAIIKSLEGTADCKECRMMRLEQGAEVPLDLQIFTRPVDLNGSSLTAIFALDVSHEKRLAYLNRTFYHTLVNGVGGISALVDLMDPDADNGSLLELLEDASLRTLRKILYHRDIETAEQGRLAVDMEAIDSDEFLRSMVKEECRLRNTQHSCAEVDVSCGEMWADRRILGHVLGNMLENALEAREESPGRITLACTGLEDGRVVISMRNPGIVPPNIRKQMFKRYVSTKSQDRGLGTYVMKLFTERYLGGEVAFSSENGETTFTVTLPAPPK
jgi:hypothetical protein